MPVAAKAVALTAAEIFTNPEVVTAAAKEHAGRVGPDFVYEPLIGDRDLPLDYRVKRKPEAGSPEIPRIGQASTSGRFGGSNRYVQFIDFGKEKV